jgi:hypothetical protein
MFYIFIKCKNLKKEREETYKLCILFCVIFWIRIRSVVKCCIWIRIETRAFSKTGFSYHASLVLLKFNINFIFKVLNNSSPSSTYSKVTVVPSTYSSFSKVLVVAYNNIPVIQYLPTVYG